MKKLIIVRHGDYHEDTGLLALSGARQINALAEIIKSQQLNGSTPRILSSTALRAVESAEILGRILGSVPDYDEILWSGNNRRTQLFEVLDLLKQEEAHDLVILVTHLEFTEELPSAFGKEFLEGAYLRPEEIYKGEALVIDCETKTIEKLVAL